MDFAVFYQNSLKLMFPEIFLATSILTMTVYASFCATIISKPLVLRSISNLALLSLTLTSFLIFNMDKEFLTAYRDCFIFDFFSDFVKLVIIGFTILCLFISRQNLLRLKINSFEYILLVLSAILGLMLLVSSNDLISLYLALEMQSLSLYVLAASKKDSTFSTEAGLKYFILGSLSSALLLFGISMLYGLTGTTNFTNFALLFSEDLVEIECILSIKHALVMILVAFFFKVSAAPFHAWSPDVYEGSPTSSTVFFSIVPKLGLFAILVRVFADTFYLFYDVYVIAAAVVSLVSIFVGSLGALKQKKLKRLLAYSSISHVGYLLIGFAANSVDGFQSVFFYLIIYMLTNTLLWSILLNLEFNNNTDRSKTLVDFAFAAKSNFALGFSGLVALFSLMGIPPFAGFAAKMFVFASALDSSLFIVPVLGIVMSVISSYYYLRLIKNLYFENVCMRGFVLPVSYAASYTISFSTILLFFFFFNPNILYLVSYKLSLCLL